MRVIWIVTSITDAPNRNWIDWVADRMFAFAPVSPEGLALVPIFGCSYQPDEEWMGPHGPGEELRMELAANHIWMVR